MTINVYPPYGSSSTNPIYTYTNFSPNAVDAFGRLRVSNPYTLFDSQARFGLDSTYSYATTGVGASFQYSTGNSAVNLTVGTAAGTTVAQTYRVFPYQPGKSMLILQTFTMAVGQTNLTQRVGLFNTSNGVFLQQTGTASTGISFNVRSSTTTGSQTAAKGSWNVDNFDGTGPSGVALNLQKTQILWFDIEWLGVGNVRCGFVVNGTFYTAHIFRNANINTSVYMQTAVLPLRYEISTTGSGTSSATLQQICSTVISEGGYEQVSQTFVAKNSVFVTLNAINTANLVYTPITSIRVNQNAFGAIVLPLQLIVLPGGTNPVIEIALIKNGTFSVAPSFATPLCISTTASGTQNQVDAEYTPATGGGTITATADNIVQIAYASSSQQSTNVNSTTVLYNWDLQLGTQTTASTTTTYANNSAGAGVAPTGSDVYTVAARSISGTSVTAAASLSFYNLTV